MTSPEPIPGSPASPGLATTLRAAVNAGALTGALAGLFDGLVRLAGIDSSLFLTRWGAEGLWSALTHGWPRAADLFGLAGCVLGAVFVYVCLAVGASLVVGAALHPWLKRRGLVWRYERLLGLGLAAWIALELFWWTRPVVFPGVRSTDPRRLGAALAIGLASLAIGWQLPRLRARVPRGWRVATPFLIVFGVLGGGLYLLALSGGSDAIGRKNERNRDLPNVLVFVVDALRQDTLGPYGHALVETPVLDRLAREGVVFDNAFVQAPFTWTSFGSLLTGKYPRRHGLVKMAPGYSMAPNVTLPYHLKSATRKDGVQLEGEDYVGAAFMTGTLSHGSGLLRGFDVYFEAMVGHDLVDIHSRWSRFRSGLLPWLFRNKLKQRFDNGIVASTAVDWLGENGGKRFVSMVHYYSTHTPYDPPDEFREKYTDPDYAGPVSAFYAASREAIESGDYSPTDADVQQIQALYYGGVTQADAMIGQVIDELERRGVLNETIVVVTSDHGESLGEHGLWEHNNMYQDNLRIPLILRYPPGLPGGERVDARVDSIDLLPTLCDLMGLEPPDDEHIDPERAQVDGVSLLPLVRRETDSVRRFSFAENNRFRSIQDGDWKLIVRKELLEDGGWERMLAAGEDERNERWAQRPRLFHVGADPLEENELFEAETERAHELYTELKAWSDTMPIGDHMLIESARDFEAERNLNDLGYGGGVGVDDDDDEEEPKRPR